MRSRARLLLGFAIATMVMQACSSPDSSPASPDSGDGGGGPGVDSSSGVDSGMSMGCDASLPLGGDAGGACTACKVTKCAGELRQCAADCTQVDRGPSGNELPDLQPLSGCHQCGHGRRPAVDEFDGLPRYELPSRRASTAARAERRHQRCGGSVVPKTPTA
jgi:hypothetical protein